MTEKQAALRTDKRDWSQILEVARNGDAAAARKMCSKVFSGGEPFAGASDYLLGRCLAEAGEDLEEAVVLLERAVKLDAKNQMTPWALALALMRSGRSAEAAAILEKRGLPHDNSLLAQLALQMEAEQRTPPETLPEGWPPWHPQLGPDPTIHLPPLDEVEEPPRPAPEEMSRAQRKELTETLARLESDYFHHKIEPLALIREVHAALSAGLADAELHWLGGVACEQGGDSIRARMHLSIALEMDPDQYYARTFLGRVYWRTDWFELAEHLWRSIPVHGPDDYGRHYHLALLHAAEGRRQDAFYAMNVALEEFFMEVREFFIEQAFQRWMRVALPERSLPNEDGDDAPRDADEAEGDADEEESA